MSDENKSDEKKAEGTNEAVELDNAALAEATGGAKLVLTDLLRRNQTLIREVNTLRVSELLGRNLLRDGVSVGNTDWQ